MVDLSIKLNQSGIGGVIGGHLINHLCYADDLCLISLSSAGMQKLLDICSTYATEHNCYLIFCKAIKIGTFNISLYPNGLQYQWFCERCATRYNEFANTSIEYCRI